MRKLLMVLLASSGSVALAHAELTKATPAENAAVSAPKQVDLSFSEAVEVRFSIFKVYPLNVKGDALAVNRAADALLDAKLKLKGDAARRVDAGVKTTARTSTNVVLALKPDLKPGMYEVMWNALAVDGHAEPGRYVFRVK